MAVPIKYKYPTMRFDQRRLRKTTQGWSLLVNWKDGTESWVRPAELKDSYPIELAEFAKALSIADEPAFAWCNHLRSRSCPADPDVWMRSAIKSDGTEVYGYVFLHIDDALSIGVEAKSVSRKEIDQSLMSHLS
jgi:hypothetical protein